jgi:hypothetical protein
MDAGGREAEEHIAFCNIVARQDFAALHRADGKARKVIVACSVHARHFRRFTANQGSARHLAAIGNTSDHIGGRVDIQRAGCKIVEEKQRLSALNNQIVDAHGNKIDPDGAVLAGFNRDLQLGANAVIGGHQNRVGESGTLEIEETTETANITVRSRAGCRLDQRLDPIDQGIASVDVDPGVGIGQTIGTGRRRLAHEALQSWLRLALPAALTAKGIRKQEPGGRSHRQMPGP